MDFIIRHFPPTPQFFQLDPTLRFYFWDPKFLLGIQSYYSKSEVLLQIHKSNPIWYSDTEIRTRDKFKRLLLGIFKSKKIIFSRTGV